MNIQQPFPSLLLLAVSISVTIYAGSRWKHRRVRPTAGTGALLLWCGSFWLLTNALEIASLDLTTAYFWNRAQYVGIAPVSLLWLYMALQFTGYTHVMTRRRLLLLGVIPVISVIMVLTNEYHQLFLRHVNIGNLNSFANVVTEAGPFQVILYSYGYALIALGTYLLTQKLLRTRGFRWQGSAVMLGVALTVFANILDWSQLNPISGIRLTPLALCISIPLFALTLNRARRADLVPFARSRVIQSMEDAVIVLDVENRILDMNSSAEDIVGRQLAEVSGKVIDEACPPLTGQPNTDSLKSSGSRETRFGNADQQRVFDVRESSLKDWRGQLLSRIIVLRDITERVRAEEALRQSEERYRLHFANVNDVIYSFDSQLNLLTVTPSVERHLGLEPANILGKSMLELGVLAPEFYEKAVTEAMRVLAGERIEGAIYEFIATDGTRKTAEISASPLVRDNKVIAAINVARDISERVHAEKLLRATLAEKETLLKEIHHRVKNNMQIIASLLSLQAATVDNPVIQAQFEDSQNRIRSMALVHERLYRSQDLGSIDLSLYMQDLVGHLIQSSFGQGKSVNIVVEVGNLQLNIDQAVPCGLIVNELVSNALKYAFPDGRGGEVRIEVQCSVEGQYRLVVSDNGVGMPEGMDFRKTASLGLKLVNSLARQLGGTVEMNGMSGTVFVIQFSVPSGRES